MSRPDSIESLLAGSESEIAPTVTDLTRQGHDEPAAKSTPAAKPQPARSEKSKPVNEGQKKEMDSVIGQSSTAGQPIRVQISTSDGSEIAAALEEVRSNIPSAFQKNFNLGAFFKEVLQDNDTEIAKMIRASARRE